MALIVVDASVLVKVLVRGAAEESDTERALALWERVRTGLDLVLQPPHWLAEVVAVLARLSPRTAEQDAADLYAMEFEVLDTVEVYRRAARIGVELDHHLFDTLYHAVALEIEGAVLVTADERYHRKARRLGSIVPLAGY